tara:strand:+ start:1392 stop:1766 length:375 start_codon:yes stop_codon:yes gene_type:complete
MTSTTEIRELFDRAIARCDTLLEIYDRKLMPPVLDLDEFEGPMIRLEPAEVYDSCIVGVDPHHGRIIYDEQHVLMATKHHNDWSLDEALEWCNYNTFTLTEMEHGPVFMTAGRISVPSAAGPEK